MAQTETAVLETSSISFVPTRQTTTSNKIDREVLCIDF